MKHTTSAAAIEDAMRDYLENDGVFTPHDPAICRDAGGWYYGSALHGEAVYELSSGFGSWTPETAADIDDCAAGLAAEIEEDANA